MESASSWSNVAVVVFTLAAAVAGVVALHFASRLNTEKDAAFERFKVESAAQIAAADARAADANRQAAEAGRGTAEALAQAAAANERAGALEVESARQRERAANAERTLLELQQRVQDRAISPAERTALISALRNTTGQIRVSCVGGNPEPCAFARQLVEILRESGWNVSEFSEGVIFVGASPSGLILQVANAQRPPARAVVLQQALGEAGFPTDGEVVPGLAEDVVALVVGSKR